MEQQRLINLQNFTSTPKDKKNKMAVDETNKIILGNKRFQGSINVDGSEKIVLEQTVKEQVEYERYLDVNLLEVFDFERQKSTVFRPITKYSFIFKNAYSGATSYLPYYNYMYYSNLIENTQNAACFPNAPIAWSGFPQYCEFDFIRTDNNKNGYTSGPINHQLFVNQSASTYNWNHYITYPYSNDDQKVLYLNDPEKIITWFWVAKDGIPFYIKEINDDFILFQCPIKHGLIVGNNVELTITYNGNNFYEVSELGDGGFGSDEYIFKIDNVGYIGNIFSVGLTGTFKRVLDVTNSGETTSKYYVKILKVLSNPQDATLVNSGYEQSIYNIISKQELVYSGGTPLQALSPPSCPRTSILEGSQNYTLSFNIDFDMNNLIDNQKRPVTELFFTTVWKGYYGWSNRLKEGFAFNGYLDGVAPNWWWDTTNNLSDSTLSFSTYFPNNPQGLFPCTYTDDLISGDTIEGDFCEWNDFEQLERVISKKIHKFTLNQNYFVQLDSLPPTNKYGYYYFPHSSIKLRQYSPYIEEADPDQVIDIPPYAFYSNLSNGFRFRDIYPYGYIDADGFGVDYPFTNGKHYPFKNTIFRVFSEGIGVQNITTIEDPLIDECE